MKTIIQILLAAAIGFLAYFCIMSVLTPINFDKEKKEREILIIQRLVDIRTAEVEFRSQKQVYTTDFTELLNFLKTGKKASVIKEGVLSDSQLESGLTEEKAAQIVRLAKATGNDKDVIAKGLQNFSRDTIYLDLISTLYDDRYTAETIDEIKYIPYSEKKDTFVLEANNSYVNSTNFLIPLFQASCRYETYLSDLNRQELLNEVDKQIKLEKFPGLKVGNVLEPNNNAGNWE